MGEPLDAEKRAELFALRRRAYGPAPDIVGDEAALRRLAELEAAWAGDARPPAAPRPPSRPVPESAPSHSAPEAAPSPAVPEVVPEDVIDGMPPGTVHAPTPHPQRRRFGGWLVGALVVVAALIVLLMSLSPRPDAVLAPVDTPRPLPVWVSDGWFDSYIDRDPAAPYVVYASFGGVEPWVLTTRTGARCLILTFGSQIGSTEPSCGRDGLAPSYTLHSTEWMPEALQEVGPPGTIVRFVLRGESVEVTVALPPVETPAG